MTTDLVKVSATRLFELEKKERAHDDYLEAMRRLREDNARLELERERRPFSLELEHKLQGRKYALADLSRHIVNVMEERDNG